MSIDNGMTKVVIEVGQLRVTAEPTEDGVYLRIRSPIGVLLSLNITSERTEYVARSGYSVDAIPEAESNYGRAQSGKHQPGTIVEQMDRAANLQTIAPALFQIFREMEYYGREETSLKLYRDPEGIYSIDAE